MGEQEFLISRKFPLRELKEKHIRIAGAITPLLKRCGPEEFRKAKERVESLLGTNGINRRSLFSTLQSMGFEPVDARNTPLFDAVPGLIPLRTIQEAWNIVHENMWLVRAIVNAAIRLGKVPALRRKDAENEAMQQLFENSLHWDERLGALSTYAFSCSQGPIGEMDKQIGPYLIPQAETSLMSRIAEERRKDPGVSNAELAGRLGTDPERIRVLDIGRSSRSTAAMDHDNIFYSGGEDDGLDRRHRTAFSEVDLAHAPPSPEAEAMRDERDRKIREIFSSFRWKDASIAMGFLGIGAPKQDFEGLARDHGCTVATVKARLGRVLRMIKIMHGEELSELLD